MVKDKFIEYFGTKRLEITSRKDASEYLLSITGKIQEKMVSQLKSESACYLVKDLYKILDEVFHDPVRQSSLPDTKVLHILPSSGGSYPQLRLWNSHPPGSMPVLMSGTDRPGKTDYQYTYYRVV